MQNKTQKSNAGCFVLLIILITAVVIWYGQAHHWFGAHPTSTPTFTSPPPTSTLAPTATLLPAVPPPSDPDASNIYLEIILDTSGSMSSDVFPDTQRSKIEAAKDAIATELYGFPKEVNLGLRTFGQPGKPTCSTELLASFASDNAGNIVDALKPLQPEGWTPLTEAIRAAANDINFFQGATKTIWVYSDGKQEGCEPNDPCDQIKGLKQLLGINFRMHAIGMYVDSVTEEQLRCIAREGGGTYYDVRSEEDLKQVTGVLFQRITGFDPPDTLYRNTDLQFQMLYPGQWQLQESASEVSFVRPEGDLTISVRVQPTQGDPAYELSQRLDELKSTYTLFSSQSDPMPERFILQEKVEAADAYYSKDGVAYQALITVIILDSDNAYFVEITGFEQTVRRFLKSTMLLDMIASLQFL